MANWNLSKRLFMGVGSLVVLLLISDAAAAKAPDAGPGAAVSGAPANPVEAAGAAGQPQPVAGKASDSSNKAAAH